VTGPVTARSGLRHPFERPIFIASVLLNVAVLTAGVVLLASGHEWLATHPRVAKHADEIGAAALAALLSPFVLTFTRNRGDGVITPAISVLSAVEGINVATTALEHYVLPITVVILNGLFAMQPMGTAKVGRLFGPVLFVWFVALAALGVHGILREPAILNALNPASAARFFARNGRHGLLVLGAVVLCVTGGEALYADMGHFGRAPIRAMWFGVAMPALVLNYFGQGALMLATPGAVENPFFQLAPAWAIIPLVVLATLATVIASQALISAAFSLTRQAVQLGYSPPVRITHTSATEIGQIYISSVNWTLMLATVGLVLGFRTSTNLASAYGIAVTMTMAITSVLFFLVARELWGWSLANAGVVVGAFLVIDLGFLGPNLLKVHTGGWFPLVAAGAVFTLMSTWRTGRRLTRARLAERAIPLADLLRDLAAGRIPRIPGTAVFLTGNPEAVPTALEQHLRHSPVLHEQVYLLNLRTRDVAYVPAEGRVTTRDLGAFMVNMGKSVPRSKPIHADDLEILLGRPTRCRVRRSSRNGGSGDPRAATLLIPRG